MSYDIYMDCKCCKHEVTHIYVTYNDSKFYYDAIDIKKGIREIYGKTGKECVDILKKALNQINKFNGSSTNFDALTRLLTQAKRYPYAIFRGD